MDEKTHTLPLGGTSMDYLRFGGGSRALVVIPGLNLRGVGETRYTWLRMYRPFSEDYEIFVFDRKADVPQGYDLAGMAEDTAQAMDALGIRQADVIGISQGGMIAQYLALDRPELVRKLVLGVTMSRPNETIRRAVRQWTALAERGDFNGIARDVMERAYSDDYLETFGKLLLKASAMRGVPPLDRFAVLTKACLTCDTYDRLGDIRCPVLVLGGRKDRVLTGEASVELAEKLGCELYMYEDLGHSAWEEAGDFNARALAFLRE